MSNLWRLIPEKKKKKNQIILFYKIKNIGKKSNHFMKIKNQKNQFNK
jgi:hypothetical protein